MDDGPVVFVSGASSGIGWACARRLAAKGFRVFGAARSRDPGPSGHPPDFTYLQMDVRDDTSVRTCVSRVLADAGRIDVLVNCAGVIVGGPAEEMLMDEVRDQVETNLIGTMRTCAAVLPGMRARGGGKIITIGSLAGLMGLPFQAVYSATKYGLEGYSESLQMEVQSFGIQVVLIDPGDVRTEITQHRKRTRGVSPDSPYRRNLESAMREQARSERKGWSPERIAALVEKVIRTRSPRFRYMPGPFIERLAPAVRRILPNRLFLKILAAFSKVG